MGQSSLPEAGVIARWHGALELAGDVDVFRVFVRAGMRYEVELRVLSAEPDDQSGYQPAMVGLELTRPDGGMQFAYPSGNQALTARLAETASTSGTLSLRVSDHANVASASHYELLVRALAADDHPDQAGMGDVLLPGEVALGSLDTAGDRDRFRIYLNEGERIRIELHPTQAALDRNMHISGQLFGLAGNTGAVNELGWQGWLVAGESRYLSAGASGGYEIQLQGSAWGEGAGLRPTEPDYSLSYTVVAADDHSELPAWGSWLQAGEPGHFSLDGAADADYFLVPGEAGQAYRIVLSSPQSVLLGDSVFLMVGAANPADDLGQLYFLEDDFQVLYWVPQADTVLAVSAALRDGRALGIQAGDTTLTGDIHFEPISADERLAIEAASAAQVTFERPQAEPVSWKDVLTGQVPVNQQADYIVHLDKGDRYEVRFVATEGYRLNIYRDAEWFTQHPDHWYAFGWGQDQAGASTFVVAPDASGDFRISVDHVVYPYDPDAPQADPDAPFRLQWRRLEADDHADNPSDATPLPLGGVLRAQLEGGERDLMAFDATQGQSLLIHIQATNAGDWLCVGADVLLADGRLCLTAPQSGSTLDLVFTAPADGRYILSPQAFGDITVSLQEAPADDYPNDWFSLGHLSGMVPWEPTAFAGVVVCDRFVLVPEQLPM